jgi:hypothetical protein
MTISQGDQIMIVHKHYYRDRQSGDARIVVIPSTSKYVEAMEQLHQIVYGYGQADITDDDDETLTAAKFRNHLRVFPEGQFTALDTHSNQVVGVTVSMLMNYDPAMPVLEPWVKLTDFG